MFTALQVSARTVYLKPGVWAVDGANQRFALYAFEQADEVTNEAWVDFVAVEGEDGLYKAELADNGYTHIIPVRMNGETTENNWDNKWNQTEDIDIPQNDLTIIKITGWGEGDPQKDYYATALYGYVAVGSAELFGGAWDGTIAGNVLTLDADGHYVFKKTASLSAGDYAFKVLKNGETWIPAGENKVFNIAENGTYPVTITLNEAGDDLDVLVQNYYVGFNEAIQTGNGHRDFTVARKWKHIIGEDNYDSYGPYYMTYSYNSTAGVDGTGTLIAYEQRGYDASNQNGPDVVYDLLVTPKVSGVVTLNVKSSATGSKAPFVEFYAVNDNGTERGELIQRFNESDFVADTYHDGWYTVTLNVETAQRLGIRAQYVYMDEFAAQNVEFEAETSLAVTSVMNTDGKTGFEGTNPVFAQQPDGTMLVNLKVELTNTGDVDFVAGETVNYTLTLAYASYASGTKTYLEDYPIAIEENIAAGETKTVDVSANVPFVSGYKYWFVRENVTGTTSSSYRYASSVAYESKFIFDKEGTSYTSSSSATTTPISFGKVTEATTLAYEIYNSGNAPLTINSFAVPAGFETDAPEGEFTVAAGEKKVVNITFLAAEPGIFTGNVEVAYTNWGKEQTTYTLAISGTVVDSSKNWITFDNGAEGEEFNGQFPAGSIHSDNVYISKETVNEVDNFYLSTTSTVTKFITPLLHAAAGESLTFDAWYGSWSSTANVKVYASKDRVTWTELTTATGLGTSVKTYTATIAEEGDYYIAFELNGYNTHIDNIYGLTLATAPEHDWYVSASNVPAIGKQNAEYAASITLHNIAATADQAEAKLYVDGEVVATETVELAANEKTAAVGTGRNNYSNIEDPVTIDFSFVSHVTGEHQVYIELSNGFATEEVTVNFAEETFSADASLEGASAATSNTFVAPYWNHSGSESLLTESLLASMGITPGTKINRIYVNGYNTSGEVTQTTKVWIGNTDATELASPFEEYDVDANAENLSLVYDDDYVFQVAGTSSEHTAMFSVDLSADPFEYTGGSIRIIARGDITTTYKQVYFEKSNVNGFCYAYSYDSGSKSYSATAMPAFHFELAVEPTVLAGTVKDGETPVEGATVTLVAQGADVQYSGVTDAEGNFSVPVIQDSYTYDVTVAAEGYEAQTFEAVDLSEALNVNFGTTDELTLTISSFGWASFSNAKAVQLPAGVTAYIATEKDGEKVDLVAIEDGIVPANTGVLLKAAEGTYPVTFVETDVTYADNLLKAALEEYVVPAALEGYIYAFGTYQGLVGFVLADAGYRVSAGKAYLELPTAGAKPFIGISGTTGINGVNIDALDGQATYNLQGQRVNGAQRGVVIRGGKKYIVK